MYFYVPDLKVLTFKVVVKRAPSKEFMNIHEIRCKQDKTFENIYLSQVGELKYKITVHVVYKLNTEGAPVILYVLDDMTTIH